MAEFSARQVVVIAAVAGALVGGMVAGGVAVAASGDNTGTASSSGGSSQVATAAVVRTNLTNTVQVGGSIGYDGSYTVAALHGGGIYTWLPEVGAGHQAGPAASTRSATSRCRCCTARSPPTGRSMSACPTAPMWAS